MGCAGQDGSVLFIGAACVLRYRSGRLSVGCRRIDDICSRSMQMIRTGTRTNMSETRNTSRKVHTVNADDWPLS
jgi:hypothetical protein